MKTIKNRIRNYLGINTELTYCLNKLITVQQKIDVIYANIESIGEEIQNHKSDTISYYHNINDIEDKLSYYDDYDLSVFESEITSNSEMLSGLKYTVDTLYNKVNEFTTDTGEDTSHNNNVYIVDDIELLRPKIVNIIDDVMKKYTVSVAASIRKME